MTYKFKIETVPLSNNFIEFFPFYDVCSISVSCEGNLRKVMTFDGALFFVGKEFDTLFNIYKSGINFLNIKIYKNATLEFEGTINLRANFNTKTRELKCKVITKDVYSTLNKNKDTEYNILSFLINRYSLILSIDSQEITKYSECTTKSQNDYKNEDLIVTADYDLPINYQNFGNETLGTGKKRHVWYYFIFGGVYETEIISDNTDLDYEDYRTANQNLFSDQFTYYFRRTYYLCYNNIWVYKKQVFNFDTLINDYTNEYLNYYVKASSAQDTFIRTYTRFLKFSEVLKELLKKLDSEIIFNELNYCTYFNISYAEFLNLYISQKSDIKRYNSTNPATLCNITFTKLMDYVKQIFNLDWYLDSSKNFYFKHPSEFVSNFDLDLTDIPFYNNLKQFNVKDDTNINKEVWNFEKTANTEFSTSEILYDTENKEIKIYEMSEINNDLVHITDDNNISDFGYSFAVCDNSLNILNSENYANGLLSSKYLVENFQRNGDRPYPKDINNMTLGCANYNEHIEFQFTLDYISNLDFTKLVKTQLTEELGLAGAKKINVSQNLNKNFATIKLEFGYIDPQFLRFDSETVTWDTENFTFDFNT